MKDPYKVLGIDYNATDDEIKAAYRKLAKKYHPDNYANSNLSDVAEEKMKEINEAYDQIQKERSNASSNSSSGFKTQYNASSKYFDIRNMINNGNYAEAEIRLNSIPSSERDAEWNFLKGCILMQRGYFFEAQRMFETACYMDPTNDEYSDALKHIKARTNNYGNSYYNNPFNGECNTCDLCEAMLCLNCLCNGCR